MCLLSTVGFTSPSVPGEQGPDTPTCPGTPGTPGTPSLSPPWQLAEPSPHTPHRPPDKSGNLFPFKEKLIVAQE